MKNSTNSTLFLPTSWSLPLSLSLLYFHGFLEDVSHPEHTISSLRVGPLLGSSLCLLWASLGVQHMKATGTSLLKGDIFYWISREVILCPRPQIGSLSSTVYFTRDGNSGRGNATSTPIYFTKTCILSPGLMSHIDTAVLTWHLFIVTYFTKEMLLCISIREKCSWKCLL